MDLSSHPLIRSFHEAGALDPYFNMLVCDPGQSGWLKSTDLFTGCSTRLKEVVLAYGHQAWGTSNNHVAASAFIIAYLTRLVYPVAVQFVLWRRLPRATLDNLAFHSSGGRIDATGLRQPLFAVLPNDLAAGHPDAVVVNDEVDLYRRLKEWIFTANLELVIEALHRSVHASLKVSRNAVAAAFAQVLHRLYFLVEDKRSIVRDAGTFFGDSSSPLYGQVRMEVIEHLN